MTGKEPLKVAMRTMGGGARKIGGKRINNSWSEKASIEKTRRN